jgi:DMSO/TMAO reductase YedYZ heme-binding membrane subunit
MTALVLLLPLALTSTNAMMRRLGRRWRQLHRLVYPIAILGVWHFYWQVKLDTLEPSIYAAVLAALLGFRLIDWRRRQKNRGQSTFFHFFARPRVNRTSEKMYSDPDSSPKE